MVQPVAEKLYGFELQRTIEIKEINCTLRELVHQKSGAKVMHIATDDEENVFSLAFRTIPETSNGVAHILEHAVLCGSKKFPVKDPFFSMNRRSLNTFMNAMTGADFTCYPAASQVEKDFYNLLEVYCDSVFHPLLKELSFKQEGWRYDFNEHLEYKGIVFNEMKGALSSPITRLVETLNEKLYPDITYGINSGGDPRVIPELTYDEFLTFHQKYYHPSRCLFFFYGNLPLEGHLKFLDEKVLAEVERIEPIPPVSEQKRHAEPIEINAGYPIGDEEAEESKPYVAVGWLTCAVNEQLELLALSVIDSILMDTDASPLKKALMKSGLMTQAGSYLDCDNSEAPFVLILQGCDPEKIDRITPLIIETLKRIVSEGIPERLLESTLHQLELQRSEITGSTFPYGLSLFFRSALTRLHEGLPEYGLMIHSLFQLLRDKLAENPRYLEDLIETYLIDNPHRVTVNLHPDASLSRKEQEEESGRLKEIERTLSGEEKQRIKEQAALLKTFQEEKEEQNDHLLPKITLEDIPTEGKSYLLSKQSVKNLDVFHHDCFTNHLTYADMIFQLPRLTQEELPYVRLFSLLIDQVGCGGRSYEENLAYVHAHTGGISTGMMMNNQVADNTLFTPSFHLFGKALKTKNNKLFPLLKEMITSADFSDSERIKEVLVKHYTVLKTGLSQKALKYAINLGASGLSCSSRISNDWFGLNHFHLIKKIVQNFEEEKGALIEMMEHFQDKLLCLDGAHLVLTCDQKTYTELAEAGFYGLQEIQLKPFERWESDFPLQEIATQGRAISSGVSFSTKVLPAPPFADVDAPILSLATYLFNNTTLHPRIREQGGAYGGGSANNPLAGIFYFFSYRDPNIAGTLAAFDEAVEKIASGDFSEGDLEEAKLEMIQVLDSPVPPGNRGELAYSWWVEGRTPQLRQAFRRRILEASSKEVVEAVKNTLLPLYRKAPTIVFAGKDLLERENKVLMKQGKDLLEIKPV